MIKQALPLTLAKPNVTRHPLAARLKPAILSLSDKSPKKELQIKKSKKR